jgi:5-methylcytosine-specific restriction endonuclease McrA
MSESTAAKRIGAARAARRFPVILEMVAKGELHLSGVHRLKAHLTETNHREVLAEAKHLTIKDIERLVARIAPKPDVPSSLRALPQRPVAPELELARPSPEASRAPSVAEPLLVAPSAPPAPRRAHDPTPLSPRAYKLTVTLDQEGRDDLTELQDLHAHDVPNGDPAVIVQRALRFYLEHTRKKKAALTDRPRAPRPPKHQPAGRRSRAIPAHVRRAVFERDRGRCGFVGDDGHRCEETRALEFAHVRPWARGGEHSAENLGLRCRPHNRYEANRDYGEAFMAKKQREGRSRVSEDVVAYAPLRVAASAPATHVAREVASHQPKGRRPTRLHHHTPRSRPNRPSCADPEPP